MNKVNDQGKVEESKHSLPVLRAYTQRATHPLPDSVGRVTDIVQVLWHQRLVEVETFG